MSDFSLQNLQTPDELEEEDREAQAAVSRLRPMIVRHAPMGPSLTSTDPSISHRNYRS
jgi:hypothetical protein